MTPPLSHTRRVDLSYHLAEAKAWLDTVAAPTDSTAIAYAAFELRLAIERIGLEYYRRIRGNVLDESDLSTLASFKRMENRIYELEGHQQVLDAKLEFMSIVMRAMQAPVVLARPNLGRLSRHWHECSDLCHVTWTLSAATNPQLTLQSKEQLVTIHAYILSLTESLVSWPVIHDPAFAALRDEFVAGRATESDVMAYLKKVGIWARLMRPGQPSEFVGTAIPPVSENVDSGSAA